MPEKDNCWKEKLRLVKIPFLIALVFTLALALYVFNESKIQTLPVTAAMNEDQAGIMDTVILESIHGLIPGKTYRLTITYDMVYRTAFSGNGLFCEKHRKGDIRNEHNNAAIYGCSELRTTTVFVAQEPSLDIDLTMAIVPERIVDEAGTVFDPETMQLCPNAEARELDY